MNFNDYIQQLKIRLIEKQIEIYEENEIAYGLQLKVGFNSCLKKDIASINIYYSSKNPTYKHIIGAKTDNPIKSLIEEILFEKIEITHDNSITWSCYGGSDEAGKGDYFGPLVVAGFVANTAQFSDLRTLGVKDSKDLNDKTIEIVAEAIIKKYPNQFKIIKMMPEQYNMLYAKFKNSGKNLNHLLAWMHGRNIADIRQKINFEGFLVDQFAREDLVKNSIAELKDIAIIQKTKAESDVCVATASIIARYHFVKAIDFLSNKYDFNFPKGAGNHVKQALQDFEKKFGKEELTKVAKMHFKV